MDNNLSNNKASIIGTIKDEFKLNHTVFSENFYTCTLSVPRLSGITDDIQIMVSERLKIDETFDVGDVVEVIGQFRSHNSSTPDGHRLILTVFAKDIMHCDNTSGKNPNVLYLNGFICKPPVYRNTPFGREITDLLLAVNRSYNKSDYIPIIAWGRNARFAKTLKVGDNVKIWGRIQSRTYQKKISDEESVTKTAYEVSVNRMELAEEE